MSADAIARWRLLGWLLVACAVSAGFTALLTVVARGF